MPNEFKENVKKLVQHVDVSTISGPFIEQIKKSDPKLGDLAEKFNDAGKQIQKYVNDRKK